MFILLSKFKRYLGRLIFSASLCIAALSANAYQYGFVWVDWIWPAKGFYNVDQIFQITQLAPDTFWAMYLSWTAAADPNKGTYLGVQTNHDVSGNYSATSNIAIFSVWNATAASGPNCMPFGSEGSGWSCRIPLSVIHTDNNYRLRVWRLSADDAGVWWGAWIFDSSANRDIFIGRIRVDPANQLVSGVWNFTEALGDSCNRSVVHWTDPAANFTGTRYEYYSSYSNQPSLGNCPSGATPADWGWTRGAEATLGS
jgi:hypothetical protein